MAAGPYRTTGNALVAVDLVLVVLTAFGAL